MYVSIVGGGDCGGGLFVERMVVGVVALVRGGVVVRGGFVVICACDGGDAESGAYGDPCWW